MPRTNRDGPRTFINHVVVTGYEKRKSPSKHYAFVIDVTWDNDERYEVMRRYSEFFNLHETLKIMFARENLPSLPKRKFLGRSHVQKVAEARLESLNQYCRMLITLDEKITSSRHVMTFFSPKIGDRSQPKLRLHRPASLHPMKRPVGNTVWEEYCVIAAFKGENDSQMNAESGDQVRLLNKDPSGWWLVEKKGKVGWIPSSYLKKTKSDESELEDRLGVIQIKATMTNDDNNSESSLEVISISPDSEISHSPISSPEIEAQEYVTIDSYDAQGPGQISFEEGEIITVLDKMEDGWWFVSKDDEEGWVPCGYLEPVNKDYVEEEITTSSLDKEKYTTVAPYVAEEDDEISFAKETIVEVLQKSLTGWWLITFDNEVGLAPATYLKKVEETNQLQSDSGIDTETVSSFSSSSFKQSPRQRTVRKKRSTKDKPKSKQIQSNIKEEETPVKSINNRKISSKSSSLEDYARSPNERRKYSEQLYSSPRLRKGKILKEDSDESPEEKTSKRKLSRLNNKAQRSPSVSPRNSPRPDRKILTVTSLETKEEHHKIFVGSSKENSPEGGTKPNPFTNQLVDSMIKYILASDDPDLKAALRNAITSDPELIKLLK